VEPSLGIIDGKALEADDGLDDILGGMLGWEASSLLDCCWNVN
jgi:hypothetical protein